MDTQKSFMMQKTGINFKMSLQRTIFQPLMFLALFISLNLNFHQTPSQSFQVSGAITSMGEPDWSISKADLVDYLYSYEPYEPGREFRSLFPFFRQPQPQQQKQINQQQQNQAPRKSQISFPMPLPGALFNTGNISPKSNSYLPAPAQTVPHPQPAPPVLPTSYQTLPQGENLTPPKYTKFSLTDKKQYPSPQYGPPRLNPELTDITTPKLLLGPVYERPTTITTTVLTTTTTPNPVTVNNNNNNQVYQPASTATDSQTIIWPQNVDENLMMKNDETQVRFLVHKPGDEDVIRSALLEDGQNRNQDVKFIEGPMLRIQRNQKVYLPPKKKTVVYILLKEPQITTNVEVVAPSEEPVPEVFITYQKSDGAIKTKHYSPEVVKNDKYLSQLRTSATSAISNDYQNNNNNNNNQYYNNNGEAQSASEQNEAILKISQKAEQDQNIGSLMSIPHKTYTRSIQSGSSLEQSPHKVYRNANLVLCPTTSPKVNVNPSSTNSNTATGTTII